MNYSALREEVRQALSAFGGAFVRSATMTADAPF